MKDNKENKKAIVEFKRGKDVKASSFLAVAYAMHFCLSLFGKTTMSLARIFSTAFSVISSGSPGPVPMPVNVPAITAPFFRLKRTPPETVLQIPRQKENIDAESPTNDFRRNARSSSFLRRPALSRCS